MAGRVTPMRVTHVLYGGLGGHATVVFDATEGTKDDVSLVFLSPAPPLPQHKELARARGMTWTWVPANARDLRYPMRLRNALRGQDPNVIIVHSAGALLPALSLSRLPRGPALVYVEHHSMPLRERKMDVASRLALRSADAVIVLSDDYAAALKTRFPNLPHDRVHVIPNGVNTQVFAPGQKVRREPSPLRLGMQSRLTDIKDHPTLLRAVRLLVTDGRDVVLRIAGDGPELEGLKSLVADLDLADHVEFAGLLDQSELVGFLKDTDIYVHATLGEASSTAILQAMAVGLPVVASDVSGVETMLPQGAGRLVPARDPQALSSAIGFFIDHPEERALAGAAGLQHVRMEHDVDEVRRRYTQLIESVSGGQRVSPTTVVEMTEALAEVRLRTLRRGERARSADFLVWPSEVAPRVILPRSWKTLRLVHAMGILGGGNRHGVRRLLRLPIALPVYWWRATKATTVGGEPGE